MLVRSLADSHPLIVCKIKKGCFFFVISSVVLLNDLHKWGVDILFLMKRYEHKNWLQWSNQFLKKAIG